MPNLMIPTPGLKPVEMINDYARVEEPIQLECGPVKFPDGTILDILQADKFEFYIFKQEFGQAVKTWNKKTAQWEFEPDVSEEDKDINLLNFDQQDADIAWKGDFLAVGKKYQKTDDSTGFPQYFIKCFFQATDSNGTVITGLSSPSNKLKLLEVGYDYKVGFKIDQPHSLENAACIRMFVKDSSRKIIGELKLKRENDIGEIEIVNYDNTNTPLASIKLDKNGDIRINARVGRKTIINDLLEIKEISNDVELSCNNDITIKAANIKIDGNLIIDGDIKVDGIKWKVADIICQIPPHTHDDVVIAEVSP